MQPIVIDVFFRRRGCTGTGYVPLCQVQYVYYFECIYICVYLEIVLCNLVVIFM